MTKKQKAILHLVQQGKSNSEITKSMGISSTNLYSTVYKMRMRGIAVNKHKAKKGITPTQKAILLRYTEKDSVPEIAKSLGITCQTVMNHATEGFRRLGLTVKGVDRVAALRNILEQPQPPTMEDPAFR